MVGSVGEWTHPASIIAVLAVLAILVLNIWLYKKTNIKIFVFYTAAWGFAFLVRLWIMLTDMWPQAFSFENEYYVLNSLMALAYVLIAIGTAIKVKTIYSIIQNGVQSVLKGKEKK